MGNKTGERFWHAELKRLEGEMLRAAPSNSHTDAEEFLAQSLNIARDQQAKSLELRAATSLARLLRDRGRRDEAGDVLAPVCGWFTEAFDAADLIEAKALLDDLRR